VPTVTVVIPTLGTHPQRLERTLEALDRQTGLPPDALEVLVVRDAAARAELRVSPSARLLSAGPAGASAARNTGWRAARAALVLFLGDDILAGPRLVAEHLATHARHPAREAAVLGHVQWARELRVTPFMRWLERGFQFDYEAISGEEAGWGRLYTANVSLKRDLLERAGGFDESLPFLYEDLDLGRRLHDHGLRLIYARTACAEHLHPATLTEWRARMAAVARAERRFCAKHPDVPPYFHDRIVAAQRFPPGRGIGARLATLVAPSAPWIGDPIWRRADIWWRQQLAESFMRAWNEGPRSPAGHNTNPPG